MIGGVMAGSGDDGQIVGSKAGCRHFAAIEGLRLYLALWVALGHGLQTAGILTSANPLVRMLLMNGKAVALFMIVSGFVVTNLLMTRQERYPVYIARRFFRLYPAYMLACLLGAAVMDDWAAVMRGVPWQGMPGWAAYAGSIAAIEQSGRTQFWPNVLLHLPMLHGMVPDQLLDRSSQAFLPAAWSISLEWQFYLVAPAVLAAIGHPRMRAVVVIGAMLAYLAYGRGLLGHYAVASTLAGTSFWFAIGIVSRLAYDRLEALTINPAVASAGVGFVAVTIAIDPLVVTIWGVFLSYVLWGAHDRRDGRVFTGLFMSRPVRMLGQASYSLYLLHRPMQIGFAVIALRWGGVGHPTMLVVQLAAIIISLPLALVSYRYVERQGQQFGNQVINRLEINGRKKIIGAGTIMQRIRAIQNARMISE